MLEHLQTSRTPEVIEWGFQTGHFLTKCKKISKIAKGGHYQ